MDFIFKQIFEFILVLEGMKLLLGCCAFGYIFGVVKSKDDRVFVGSLPVMFSYGRALRLVYADVDLYFCVIIIC